MENKENNMKKLLVVGLLALGLTFITQPKSQAMGLFYTNATYPIAVTGAEVKDPTMLKKASGSTTNVLWIVEIGDAGIDEIARKAGIKRITHVDVNEKSVFIFWRGLTVTVYGE